MTLDEKRRILQIALTKGPKAARADLFPILLYYIEDGCYYHAGGEKISSRFVDEHPRATEIAKADLDL